MQTIQKNDVTKSNGFQWITKKKSFVRESDDIVITLASAGVTSEGKKRDRRVCIHFHNKSIERITKTKYVMLGLDGDRLYFCEADSVSGYKITVKEKYGNGTAQISDPTLLKWVSTRRGAYSLHQDVKSGLYYIQAKSID